MTALLQQALDKIQKLPEPSQNALAKWLLANMSSDIEERLDDEMWLKLSESSFGFWNDPENDIWDNV